MKISIIYVNTDPDMQIYTFNCSYKCKESEN